MQSPFELSVRSRIAWYAGDRYQAVAIGELDRDEVSAPRSFEHFSVPAVNDESPTERRQRCVDPVEVLHDGRTHRDFANVGDGARAHDRPSIEAERQAGGRRAMSL